MKKGTISATENKKDLSVGSMLVAEQILTGTDGDVLPFYYPSYFEPKRSRKRS